MIKSSETMSIDSFSSTTSSLLWHLLALSFRCHLKAFSLFFLFSFNLMPIESILICYNASVKYVGQHMIGRSKKKNYATCVNKAKNKKFIQQSKILKLSTSFRFGFEARVCTVTSFLHFSFSPSSAFYILLVQFISISKHCVFTWTTYTCALMRKIYVQCPVCYLKSIKRKWFAHVAQCSMRNRMALAILKCGDNIIRGYWIESIQCDRATRNPHEKRSTIETAIVQRERARANFTITQVFCYLQSFCRHPLLELMVFS